MKAKGEARIAKEWDSDYSSSDSDDEELDASTFDKSSLFPNEHHTCLMAKEKKVRTRDTPKYTSSSDENSDDDVDYSDLFMGLDRSKVDNVGGLLHCRRSCQMKHLRKVRIRTMSKLPVRELRSTFRRAPT
jgi:hypothetical protein